jgi:uncharacterized protein (TIGR02270 family)
MLQNPGNSEVFVATVMALEGQRDAELQRPLAIAHAVPECLDGVVGAFMWTEPGRLQGIVARQLASGDSVHQTVAVAACAAHGVDPGLASRSWTQSEEPLLRARALRAAGELGTIALTSAVTHAVQDANPECRCWAAWSSVLLGNRGVALEALTEAGVTSGPQCPRALRLALQTMTIGAAHVALQSLAQEPQDLRSLIQGSGIVGDPAYVPWLINHLSNDRTARLAGEAFSLITGTGLAELDLERKPPENFESGPTDDPNDPNVDMDPDDGLPWPDPGRVKDWWSKNGGRFQHGTRYFMGAPVTREHCIDVLKNGYQRQRILAAHYLCLLNPGTPLFNTSAPAWRQQRLLAEMK